MTFWPRRASAWMMIHDDDSSGKHADVLVQVDRAYVIYFTHPEQPGLGLLPHRRTSLQAAELQIVKGRLRCDRDRHFDWNLLIADSPIGA